MTPLRPDHYNHQVGCPSIKKVFGLHLIAYNLIRLGTLLEPTLQAA